MSKFFGLLKDDEDDKAPSQQKADDAAKATPSPAVSAQPVASVPSFNLGTSLSLGQINAPAPVVVGQLDENLRQILLKALTDAGLSSPNYLDFKTSLQNTGQILTGIPEDKIYATVFSALSGTGVTVDKLVDSGKKYLAILEQERAEFEQTMASHTATEVTARQEQIDALNADNEKKAAKIQELTEAIQKNHTDIQQLTVEMQTEGTKIDSTSKNFDVTEQLIISQINDDLDKITKYLTPVA